jgi:hypothetical protein
MQVKIYSNEPLEGEGVGWRKLKCKDSGSYVSLGKSTFPLSPVRG